MDAEDSPTAGLRNGLRSVVGFVFVLHMTLTQSRSTGCALSTDALDEVPPSHFVSSAPNAERFDLRRTARHFHARCVSIRSGKSANHALPQISASKKE